MKYLQILCCFLSLAILASCSSQSTAIQPMPSYTASLQPTNTPAVIQINQTPLSMTQAWGKSTISKFPVTFGDNFFNPGGSYGENVITDDDQICGNVELSYHIRDQAQRLQLVQSIALVNLLDHIADTTGRISRAFLCCYW